MPRGRAGLWLIPADEVRVAIARHHHDVRQAAHAFRVTDRTIRRWSTTGLPLNYGEVNVTYDEWDLYVTTGASGRTGVDRKLSKVVEAAAEPAKPVRRRAQPAPARREPRPPKKRLRTSRALLAAYKKLHSR